MTQTHPPLDDPPRATRRSFAGFIGGVIVGGVLTGAAVPLSILLLFTEGEGPHGTIAPAFIPAAVIVSLIIFTAVPAKTRNFGLGMLTGAPIAILAAFVICGGMSKI